MQSKLIKEILAIIILSSVIALTYNTISDNGIPFIRKAVELNWESDTAIDNFVKKDLLSTTNANKKSDNITYPVTDNVKKENPKNVAEVKETSLKTIKDTISNSPRPEIKKIESPKVPNIVTPTAITIDQAYKLYNNGATFLDARIESDFNLGHIKGAILMPLKKMDQYLPKINHLSKDAFLICYCDGSGCDLSIDLAKKLTELGYKNVKIFYSGWNDWKEKNYPME